MEIRPIDANALHALYAGPFIQTYAECRKALDDAPTLSLNTLRDAIYQDAVEHGLWEGENNVQGWPVECAAVIECEAGELYDAAQEWEDRLFGGYEHFTEELADVVIACFSVAGKLDIDIDAAIRRKMEINKGRPWKHGKE